MSQIGFIPVTSNQKLFFNYKELLALTENFIEQASTNIIGLENKTLDQLKRCLNQTISQCFVPSAKKVNKAERAKQANTNYILFCNAKRPEVKEKHPKMLPHEITQEIGKIWKSMTKEEKKAWCEAEIGESVSSASTSDGEEEILEDTSSSEPLTEVNPLFRTSLNRVDCLPRDEVVNQDSIKSTEQKKPEVSVINEDDYYISEIKANRLSQPELSQHVKTYLAFFQDNVDEDLTVSRVNKMTQSELVSLVVRR
jgi:hypothetical protein